MIKYIWQPVPGGVHLLMYCRCLGAHWMIEPENTRQPEAIGLDRPHREVRSEKKETKRGMVETMPLINGSIKLNPQRIIC